MNRSNRDQQAEDELARQIDLGLAQEASSPAVQIQISGGQQGNVIAHLDQLTIHQTFGPSGDK